MKSKEEIQAYRREYNKERYYRLKAFGLCVDCGKQDAMLKSLFCYECWEKRYNYKQTVVVTEEQYQKTLKRNIERKRLNYQNGLCYKCGKRPHLPNLTTCIDCHTYDMQRCEALKAERKAIRDNLRKYRLENHLCTKCGKPAKEGFKVCQHHYDVSVNNHRAYAEACRVKRHSISERG